MPSFGDLRIKIFADGADVREMVRLASLPWIKGFTTNATLIRKAGVADYRAFARSVLDAIPAHPVCFGVLSDGFEEMRPEALEISSWGRNVYVKVPVTDTAGTSALPLIADLTRAGVRLNVTALLTPGQVRGTAAALAGGAPAFVSVFAGRIADTGRDPVPMMAEAVETLRPHANEELIWASPRELLNIFQADAIGCHIITVTPDILSKAALIGKDLGEYSLETVRMFAEDARKAGYTLDTRARSRT
ncbi:MAG: transaldolase [bacterium]